MFRDYTITSPSLDGILYHDSVSYEGIERPTEIMRAFDKPKSEQIHDLDKPQNRKILTDYYNDLYGLFMRKMGQFIAEKAVSPEEEAGMRFSAWLPPKSWSAAESGTTPCVRSSCTFNPVWPAWRDSSGQPLGGLLCKPTLAWYH